VLHPSRLREYLPELSLRHVTTAALSRMRRRWIAIDFEPAAGEDCRGQREGFSEERICFDGRRLMERIKKRKVSRKPRGVRTVVASQSVNLARYKGKGLLKALAAERKRERER
jgi:hypothetical protein